MSEIKHHKEMIEDWVIEWEDAQFDDGCSCHIAPPCRFCVSGYSVDVDEFITLRLEEVGLDKRTFEQQHDENYNRAMKGLV